LPSNTPFPSDGRFGSDPLISGLPTNQIELVCARAASCEHVRLEIEEQRLPLAPISAAEHRDLRQIEVGEPVSVVRWRTGLRWHRLSFGVASEIPQAALRNNVQSEKYEHPNAVKH